MKLTVLGSGSRGNAVAVTTAEGTLLVDAGFGPRALADRARRAGLSLTPLLGVVVTHEHLDHARGAGAVARRGRCPVYASAGTLTALGHRLHGLSQVAVRPRRPVCIGPFEVTGGCSSHDAAEPLAVAVVHRRTGLKIGIAFDVGRPTAAIRRLLEEAAVLVVEANHDEGMLCRGPYPAAVRERIAGVGGHLSNRAAGQLLAALVHGGLEAIVLGHVSHQCNHPDVAATEVWTALHAAGFRGELVIASQDDPLGPMMLGGQPGQLELGLGV